MEKLLDEVSFEAPDLTEQGRHHRRGLRRAHARRHRRQRRPVALHLCERRDAPSRRVRGRALIAAWRACRGARVRQERAAAGAAAPGAGAGDRGVRSGAPATTSQLRFMLPTDNANGPGPSELDRVEIYAVTVAPGTRHAAQPRAADRRYVVGIDCGEAAAGRRPASPPPAPAGHPAVGRATACVRRDADRSDADARAAAEGAACAAGRRRPPPPRCCRSPPDPTSRRAAPAAARPAACGSGAAATGEPAPGRPAAAPPTAAAIPRRAAARRLRSREPPRPPELEPRRSTWCARVDRPRGQPSHPVTLPLLPPPAAPAAKGAFTETGDRPRVDAGAARSAPVLFNVYAPPRKRTRRGKLQPPVSRCRSQHPGSRSPASSSARGNASSSARSRPSRTITLESAATPPACVTPQRHVSAGGAEGARPVAARRRDQLIWDAEHRAGSRGLHGLARRGAG